MTQPSDRVAIDNSDLGGQEALLGYRPELDGLRAIAVLFVMAAHANFQLFARGGVGVDLFFVLSGFLITTLLLEELSARGQVAFAALYARRALRLMPALLLVVTATLIVAAPGPRSSTGVTREALYTVL